MNPVKNQSRMSFANKISILRIIAVPFFIAAILYYEPQRDYLRFTALGIFAIAILTDILDGYLARVMHQKTKAGSILDPLADKILLSSAFIFIHLKNNLPGGVNIPLWLVIIVLSRDIIILFGALVIYIIRDELILSPSKWGKYTTFFQMLTIIMVLLQSNSSSWVIAFTVLFTLFSGIDYLKKGIRVLYVSDLKPTV